MLNTGRLGHGRRADFLKKFQLELQRSLLRAENLVLVFLQLGRDEPLRVHQRLLANVVGRRIGQVGLGDFDVVAENLVVPDLQRFDAGAFLFARLEIGQPLAAFCRRRLQLVQLGMVTLADHPAVLHGNRRLIDNRPINQRHKIG